MYFLEFLLVNLVTRGLVISNKRLQQGDVCNLTSQHCWIILHLACDLLNLNL